MLPSTLIRRSLSPMFSGSRELDLDRLWNWMNEGETSLVGSYPVDIREDDAHVYIEAEMPGFTREQVQVTLENGVLHLGAERKVEKTRGESHLTERRFTRIARSFTLPTTVDENKVDARLDNGVLHLVLTKREEVRPRRIEVK